MKKQSSTNCPIAFSMDNFGDAWSLIILRDLLIVGKSHFREFLASNEKIASNILSNRLDLFVVHGLVTKRSDPKNKSAAVYVPTQKALDLLPLLFEMMLWGIKYNPNIDTVEPILRQVQVDPESLRRDILQRFAVAN